MGIVTIRNDKKKASMAMKYTVRIAFAVCVASAMLLAASAMDFPSDLDTSTVKGLKKFDKVSNDSTKKDSQGCEQVHQLAVTVVPGDDYTVTMSPPDYVEPVVDRYTLKFNINEKFVQYKGKAGVVVTLPENELERVEASVSSCFNIMPDAAEDGDTFKIEASTSAMVFVKDLEDDDLQVTASTSALVVVSAKSGSDDMDVDLKDISTSATVHIDGAHEVDCDDISTSATVELVGNNLESVEIDDISTSATVFAIYTNDDSDTEMTVDDISTSATVTVMNCDDVEVKDAFQGTLVTDDSKNCDQVKELTQGPFGGLTCTVDDSLKAPETPDWPESVVMDVDLTTVQCGTITFGGN